MRLNLWVRNSLSLLLITILATFAIAEVTARLITETAPNGIKKFGMVAMLPLRPDEMLIRKALEGYNHDHLLMPDRNIGWNVRPGKTDDGDHTNAQGIRTNQSTFTRSIRRKERYGS